MLAWLGTGKQEIIRDCEAWLVVWDEDKCPAMFPLAIVTTRHQYLLYIREAKYHYWTHGTCWGEPLTGQLQEKNGHGHQKCLSPISMRSKIPCLHLPTLKQGINTLGQCLLCGYKCCTMLHIFNCCQYSLRTGRYNWHYMVLRENASMARNRQTRNNKRLWGLVSSMGWRQMPCYVSSSNSDNQTSVSTLHQRSKVSLLNSRYLLRRTSHRPTSGKKISMKIWSRKDKVQDGSCNISL